MFRATAFARSISVFLSRRHRSHGPRPPAAAPAAAPARSLAARVPALAKAALAVTLTGWLRNFSPLRRAAHSPAMDALPEVVPAEPLYPMRGLPPFSYYPLLAKETLVPANDEPARRTFAVVRLTFAYPACGLDMDPATHSVKVLRPGWHKPRSYTPTRAGAPGSFELTVKVYPGGSSAWLAALPVGTPVGFIGPLPLPIKRVAYEPAERTVVVALGIGITLGLAGARKELAAGRDVVLVQAVRFQEEAIFQSEIAELRRKYGARFDVRPIASGERVEGWAHGRVSETFLEECVGETPADDVRFLVVGTKGMMRQVWALLGKMGYSYRRHALVKK